MHGNSGGTSVRSFYSSLCLYWREHRVHGDPPTKNGYIKILRRMAKIELYESGGAQKGENLRIRGRWLRPDSDFFPFHDFGDNIVPMGPR